MRRYPGAAPFEDTAVHHDLFKGRGDEIESIYHQVLASRLLVVYGVSGLGKTSLLRAGVFPKLREAGFVPIYLHVRQDHPEDLMDEICEVARNIPGVDFVPGEQGSLWEFFKTSMFWKADEAQTPILVFDQFEELFTLKDASFRQRFGAELGSLVSGRMPAGARARRQAGESTLRSTPPQVKVVLSIREEYVGALQELAQHVPAVLQQRFRLVPLSRRGATAAIEEPARSEASENLPFDSPLFGYDAAALRHMLDYLEGESGQIESWQLQLLCEHVEDKVIAAAKAGASSITVKDAMLGGKTGMDAILRNFYAKAIGKVRADYRRRARLLCEEGLLSKEGHRLTLSEAQIFKEFRLNGGALDLLVNAFLLRREKRLGSVFYELSHDSLVQPILQSSPWRLPRKWRHSMRVGVPLVVTILAGLVVWATQLGKKNDDLAQAKYQEQAERDRAEYLVTSLMNEEWYEKLRALGRSELLDDILIRTEEYLKQPAYDPLTRPAYLRNRAIAQRYRGQLFVDRGDLLKALNAFNAADDDLRALLETDPANVEWQSDLAKTLLHRSTIERQQGQLARALDFVEEAARHYSLMATETEVARHYSLMSKLPGQHAALNLALSRLEIANLLTSLRRNAEALAGYDAVALLVESGIRNEGTNPRWHHHLIAALDGRATLYIRRGQPGDHQRAMEDYELCLKHGDRLIELDPMNAKYHYRRAVVVNRIGNVRLSLQPSEALKSYQTLYETIKALKARDPHDSTLARDLAMTENLVGQAQLRMGNTSLALSQLRNAHARMAALAVTDHSNLDWLADEATMLQEIAKALDANSDLGGALNTHLDALAIAEDLARRRPHHPDFQLGHHDALVLVGDALASNKDATAALERYKEAEPVLDALLAAVPRDAQLLQVRAGLHLRVVGLRLLEEPEELRRLSAALEVAREAARLSPESVYALYQVAGLHREIARRQSGALAVASLHDAIQAAKSAIRLKRDAYLAHNEADLAYGQLARVYSSVGDEKRAVDAQSNARTHAIQAVASRRDDRILKSNALRSNVSLADAMLRLAEKQRRESDGDGTLQTLRQAENVMFKATQLDGAGATDFRKLAQVRRRLGDATAANNWLGRIKWYDGALLAAQKSLSMKPDDPHTHHEVYLTQSTIAEVSEKSERRLPARLAALEAIERAAGLDNRPYYRREVGRAHAWLGQQLADAKQFKLSLFHYQAAVAAAKESLGSEAERPDPMVWLDLHAYHAWLASLREQEDELNAAASDWTEAMSAIMHAVRLEPNRADVRERVVKNLTTAIRNLDDEQEDPRRPALDGALGELTSLMEGGKLDPTWKSALQLLHDQRRQRAQK